MKSILRIPLMFNDHMKSEMLNDKINDLEKDYRITDIQYLINESDIICIITHTVTKLF